MHSLSTLSFFIEILPKSFRMKKYELGTSGEDITIFTVL